MGGIKGLENLLLCPEEPRLASFASVLDTIANHGPGGAEALGDEGLEDPRWMYSTWGLHLCCSCLPKHFQDPAASVR